MKPSTTTSYFKASMPADKTILLLQSMEEFCRYLTIHHVHTIFLLQLENQASQYFACLQQGSVIAHASLGFDTLEDYAESKKAGFPEAEMFYAAKKEGYNNHKDYLLVKETGIADAVVFDKMKKGGFIEGYADWAEWTRTNNPLPEGEKFDNPFMLYQYASKGVFNDYKQFKTAIALGFTDANYYADAIDKGFKNAADYKDGLARNLLFGERYYMAIENNIRDFFDYQNYMQLNAIKGNNAAHDQGVLLSVISKLPQDKKVSINKLGDLLKEAIAAYAYEDSKEMPGWFTQLLNNTGDISHFLQTTDDVLKFGTYDSEGEYFETKHLNERKVVLDGANVAHGIAGDSKTKPTVENMLKVIKKLKCKGFTEITVISDASLKHRLSDKEKLAELEKSCEYLSAPAEASADMFLIDFVKNNRCLLVTNDTFRDWKIKDKWVAENIDYYKLSFMIDGDKVLMPDIDTLCN